MVTFFVRGEPMNIVIDDWIALKPNWYRWFGTDKEILNAKPSKHYPAWWLVLLEKAYAKMYVTYDNLNWDTPV